MFVQSHYRDVCFSIHRINCNLFSLMLLLEKIFTKHAVSPHLFFSVLWLSFTFIVSVIIVSSDPPIHITCHSVKQKYKSYMIFYKFCISILLAKASYETNTADLDPKTRTTVKSNWNKINNKKDSKTFICACLNYLNCFIKIY